MKERLIELLRFDENAARRGASAFEECLELAKMQDVYETLHPEAKQGGAPGRAGGG